MPFCFLSSGGVLELPSRFCLSGNRKRLRTSTNERHSPCWRCAARAKVNNGDGPWDVVIIGAGFGGLSCAALTSAYGLKTLVLESHYAAGGVAHGFTQGPFHFDTGPSFFCGLSQRLSRNPLKQALDAVEEKVSCVPYDKFVIDFPTGSLEVFGDPEKTYESISKFTPEGARQLEVFNQKMLRIHGGMNVPAVALRNDWSLFISIARRYSLDMLKLLPFVRDVKLPTSILLDRAGVTDPFVRRLMDIECFLLSGLKADGTIAAEVAFMVGERRRKDAMEYPVGGAKSLVDALVRGIEKKGGEVRLRSHVNRVIVENDRCVGVEIRNKGRDIIKARKAVISNASVWDTYGSLVDETDLPAAYRRAALQTPVVESFMHLHLAIPSKGLEDLVGHHAVILDDYKSVSSPGNCVMFSAPSIWSPQEMAPPGWHIIHAYTLEPYEKWPALKLDRKAYEAYKAERAVPLFDAVRKVVPDLDERLEKEGVVVKIGSPLTHSRFARRHMGSYGPAIKAGEAEFPWPDTPIKGFFRVGDSVFPGIGAVAAACSGVICANSLVGVAQNNALVDRLFPRF